MPEIIKNKQKQNKKNKRLGRGLDSLLTIDSQSFQDKKIEEIKPVEAKKSMASQNLAKKSEKMNKQKSSLKAARPKESKPIQEPDEVTTQPIQPVPVITEKGRSCWGKR